jgi:hypothetical protein
MTSLSQWSSRYNRLKATITTPAPTKAVTRASPVTVAAAALIGGAEPLRYQRRFVKADTSDPRRDRSVERPLLIRGRARRSPPTSTPEEGRPEPRLWASASRETSHQWPIATSNAHPSNAHRRDGPKVDNDILHPHSSPGLASASADLRRPPIMPSSRHRLTCRPNPASRSRSRSNGVMADRLHEITAARLLRIK